MAAKYRKSHKFKKRKPIYYNCFFWLVILIMLVLFSIFYFFFFSDFFWVKEINMAGFEEVEEEKIILLIENNLEKDFLFFPSQSIFLVNLRKIKNNILADFPHISKLEISRSLPDGLHISAEKRQALAILDKKNNYFILDKEGIVFQLVEDDFSARKNQLIIIVDKRDNFEFSLGDKVIKKEELSQLLTINQEIINNLNIPIKESIIFSENVLIEKVTILTEQGWQIYFDLKTDIAWQTEKLKTLLEERINPEDRENLEYIEVRFGNFANPKYLREEIED